MGFADLHIHSVHSHDGTCSIPAILKYAADHTDLDVIAITDHDKVSGLKEAMALAPNYGIEVIPGCEVTTAQGHLLALFIDQAIPAGLPLVDTIKIVGAMGGLCIIPHPEAPAISGARASVVCAALRDPEVAKTLVGVETFNGGLIYTRTNDVALALGRSLNLACIGASDSHILNTIGQGTTEFEGHTAADLRRALVEHTTIPHVITGMQSAQVLGRWFSRYCLRKMGWVAWNAEPDAPMTYVRVKDALAVNFGD